MNKAELWCEFVFEENGPIRDLQQTASHLMHCVLSDTDVQCLERMHSVTLDFRMRMTCANRSKV